MQTLSGRWLVGVAGIVVALIVASVIVALTTSRGAVAGLSEDTPEGVVQGFLLAIQDRHYSQAQGYLSADLQESCTVDHVRETARWYVERSADRRVSLLGAEPLPDDRVEVRVRVTEVDVSPPFGVSERSFTQRYTLAQEDGAWRFVEPPWPVQWCPGEEKVAPLPPIPVD